MQISWTDFKTFVNARSLSIQWQDTGTYYHLEATDGLIYRTCHLNKGASDTTDLLDFENNYKSLGNKPLSAQSHPFSSKVLPNGKKLYKRETGIQTAVVQGSNTITYTITYPWVKITGMEIVNATVLDYCDFIILDSAQGTYSGIPNYQLNQFGFTANLRSTYYSNSCSYDADLYQGMQLKLVYNSVDAKTIGINFMLHEVKA